MKKILLGILIGIFICCSFFELIHLTVEKEDFQTCTIIYDKLTEKWHPDFTRCTKIAYKFFAFPIKTLWIYTSETESAIYEDKMHIDRKWIFEEGTHGK